MFRSLFRQTVAAILFGGCVAAAHAQSVTISTDSVLTAVARHFGWLESAGVAVVWVKPGETADFAVASGSDLLTADVAGQRPKAVYVLARSAQTGDAQYLQVTEALLAQRAEDVRVVLAALERAREWVNAQPALMTTIAGTDLRGQSFAGSRPGPAQAAALRALAEKRGLNAARAAALLDDSAYRAVLSARAPYPAPVLAALSR